MEWMAPGRDDARSLIAATDRPSVDENAIHARSSKKPRFGPPRIHDVRRRHCLKKEESSTHKDVGQIGLWQPWGSNPDRAKVTGNPGEIGDAGGARYGWAAAAEPPEGPFGAGASWRSSISTKSPV